MDNRSYYSGGSFTNYGTTSPCNIQTQIYNDPYVENVNPFENFSGQQLNGDVRKSCWECGSPIHSREDCPERKSYADQVNGFVGNTFEVSDYLPYYEPELESPNYENSCYEYQQQHGNEYFNEYNREPCENCGSMEHYANVCQAWNGFSGQEQKSDPFDYSSDEPVKDKLDSMMEMMREILKDMKESSSKANQDASVEYGEDEPINEVSIFSIDNEAHSNVELLPQMPIELVEDTNHEKEVKIVEPVLEDDVANPKETSVGIVTTSCPLILVKSFKLKNIIGRGSLFKKIWEIDKQEKFDLFSLNPNKIFFTEKPNTTMMIVNVIWKQPRTKITNFFIKVIDLKFSGVSLKFEGTFENKQFMVISSKPCWKNRIDFIDGCNLTYDPKVKEDCIPKNCVCFDKVRVKKRKERDKKRKFCKKKLRKVMVRMKKELGAELKGDGEILGAVECSPMFPKASVGKMGWKVH